MVIGNGEVDLLGVFVGYGYELVGDVYFVGGDVWDVCV